MNNYIFYPARLNPFGLLDDYHNIILRDEFVFGNIDKDYLKLILGGENFPIKEKYICERQFKITIPVIIISYYDCIDEDWFVDRSIVVHADVCLQGDWADTGGAPIEGFIGVHTDYSGLP